MPSAIEEAAANAAGKFAALQGTVRGLKGVFRRLAYEHKEAGVLLKRAGATTDLVKRSHLWTKVRDEMVAHEQAELKEVYPDFEAHPALIDVVAVHELEANEIQALVAQLNETPADSPDWLAVLETLEQRWGVHAAREEGQFFPRIQGFIANVRAEELEQRYAWTKNAILDEL